jgi:hypothetical protein
LHCREFILISLRSRFALFIASTFFDHSSTAAAALRQKQMNKWLPALSIQCLVWGINWTQQQQKIAELELFAMPGNGK